MPTARKAVQTAKRFQTGAGVRSEKVRQRMKTIQINAVLKGMVHCAQNL